MKQRLVGWGQVRTKSEVKAKAKAETEADADADAEAQVAGEAKIIIQVSIGAFVWEACARSRVYQ